LGEAKHVTTGPESFASQTFIVEETSDVIYHPVSELD
jgi:hypothetical protein